MSVTLLNLRTYARDWLATSSGRLSDSALTQCINIAMREIYRRRDLRFGEMLTTVAFNATAYVVTIPATFSRPHTFYYDTLASSSGAITRLNEISMDEWRDKYGSGAISSGEPVDFAMWGATNFYVGPTPTRTFTGYLDYYGIAADLSADADHNDLTDFGWEALLFSALAYASLYMLEDERAATMFGSMAKGHLDTLVREHGAARRNASIFPQLQEPA